MLRHFVADVSRDEGPNSYRMKPHLRGCGVEFEPAGLQRTFRVGLSRQLAHSANEDGLSPALHHIAPFPYVRPLFAFPQCQTTVLLPCFHLILLQARCAAPLATR